MSHRNARLTPRGAYSSSSGFEIRACLCPCRQSDGISRQCAHRWVRRFDEEVWPDSRTVRADLIVRLGAPTPAVSAESWPPAESTAAPSPTGPLERVPNAP